MKNLFILGLIGLMLSLGSCKKAANSAEDAAGDVADAASEVASKATDAASNAAQAVAEKAADAKGAVLEALNVPSFEDASITTYLGDYSAFVTKYATMMGEKSNVSQEQLVAMKDKAKAFGDQANVIVKKLKVEEMDKFNAYFEQIHKNLSAATKM